MSPGTGAGEQSQRTPRTGSGPGTTLVLVLLCVVLALVAGLGWWWRHGDHRTDQPVTPRRAVSSVEARSSGGHAAADLAAGVLSYDWEDFDAEVRETRASLAPSFRSEYARSMDRVQQQTVTQKLSLRATVREAAVSSASADRVVALVFLDQVTSSPSLPTRRVDQVRVLVTVTRDGGEWRVSRMDAF